MLQVNVARLHDDNREALSLAWVAGREGGTAVRREAAQAAALIGHLNLTHPNSIQVIGAYEAAAAVLRYARSALGLTRILAITSPGNAASIELLQKLGFRFERRQRLSADDEVNVFASDGSQP